MKKTYGMIAFLSLCSAGVWAQNPDPAKQAAEQRQLTLAIPAGGQDFGPVGIQSFMAGSVAAVAGEPYSADAVTERVQTLPDGNRIVQTTSSTVARDSQGRVRRDESLAIALPGDKGDAPKIESIDDPVAGVHWALDPQAKTAVKMPFAKLARTLQGNVLPPPPPGRDKTFFFTSGNPGAQISIQTLAKQEAEFDSNVSRVDLGTQTIEGVVAQGSRATRTLPAGAIGNEQPLVITTETWYSPGLKVLVMSKSDDPRMGTTTYRLTNIQRAEPPASLFEVPADYTIKDKPGNMVFFTNPKKDQ